MREAVEVTRTDSDTISNVFLSTVKGSVSTFLLESRELTLDDVNCLRTSTNGSERSKSNDSAALGTALIALDTDGAGEEEWLVGTPPEAKGGRDKARPELQPMASIPEAIYCSAPQIRSMHDGPPRASQRKRSMSTPEQATVYAVTAGAGLPDMPALVVPGPQAGGDKPQASCMAGAVSPPRSCTLTARSQSPWRLPPLPCTPTATGQRSTELRTPPGSGSRIPKLGSRALAGKGGAGEGSSPGGTRIPSKLRPPSSRKPQLKDLEDGWRSCIVAAENPGNTAEASAGMDAPKAAEEGSVSADCKSALQEAETQGQCNVTGSADLMRIVEKDGHDDAAPAHTSLSKQGAQAPAAKTGCACCLLM